MKQFFNNSKDNKEITKKDNTHVDHASHERCDAGNIVNTTRNAKYTVGHTEGNVFTGEQISVVRDYELDRAVSQEDIKSWWGDMRDHVKKFKNGLSSDAFSHQGFQVPMYDRSGKQITEQENIKSEVDRRTQAWIAEHGSEPLATHNINDVHLDMSGNMKTTIRDIKGNDADKIMGFSEQGGYPQITNQDSSKIIEITDDKAEVGNKRQYQNEENYSGSKIAKRGDKMDIDQPETSIGFRLPNDIELREIRKDELVDLIERAKAELERRERQGNVDSQELKDVVSKAESRLMTFNNLASNNNAPNNSNVGGVLAVVGVVSALAIGGIAFVKTNLLRVRKNKDITKNNR